MLSEANFVILSLHKQIVLFKLQPARGKSVISLKYGQCGRSHQIVKSPVIKTGLPKTLFNLSTFAEDQDYSLYLVPEIF